MHSWKELDNVVSRNNTDDDALQIVKIVKPHWKDIKTKHLEGGKANQTIICHNEADVTYDDAIIVRIRHHVKEDILFNFKNEIPVIKKASEAGLCGKILATFKNGTVLEYLPGRVLNWNDLENPHILKLCAETVADFHSLQWNAGELPNALSQNDLEIVSKQPKLFPRIREAIDCMPVEPMSATIREVLKELWTKAELSAELDHMMRIVEKLDLPVVLAHNDVQIKNLVYNESRDKIYLIDYECTSFNYEACDFANLFLETGMKTLGIVPPDVSPATDKQIELFVEFYIRRRFSIEKNDSNFHRLQKKYFCLTKAFKYLNCLYWSSLAQLPCLTEEVCWTNGDFDFRSVSRNFKNTYLHGRQEMLSLLASLCESDE